MLRIQTRHRSRAVLLTLLVQATGCSTAAGVPRHPGPALGKMITAGEIEQGGARNAWEVLRRANVHFDLQESHSGEPVYLSRRGTQSLSFGSEPLVIVNGTRTVGLRLLHDIHAHDISSIRVISGIDAAHHFGTRARDGAIVIETRRGPRR